MFCALTKDGVSLTMTVAHAAWLISVSFCDKREGKRDGNVMLLVNASLQHLQFHNNNNRRQRNVLGVLLSIRYCFSCNINFLLVSST